MSDGVWICVLLKPSLKKRHFLYFSAGTKSEIPHYCIGLKPYSQTELNMCRTYTHTHSSLSLIHSHTHTMWENKGFKLWWKGPKAEELYTPSWDLSSHRRGAWVFSGLWSPTGLFNLIEGNIYKNVRFVVHWNFCTQTEVLAWKSEPRLQFFLVAGFRLFIMLLHLHGEGRCGQHRRLWKLWRSFKHQASVAARVFALDYEWKSTLVLTNLVNKRVNKTDPGPVLTPQLLGNHVWERALKENAWLYLSAFVDKCEYKQAERYDNRHRQAALTSSSQSFSEGSA